MEFKIQNSTFIDIQNMIQLFSKNKNKNYELEAKYKKKLNLQAFTNAIKYIRSINKNENIADDFLDIFIKIDIYTYRITIEGKQAIKDYCMYSKISPSAKVILKQKKSNTIFLPNYYFNIDLNEELEVSDTKKKEVLAAHNDSLKTFRLKKRFQYITDQVIYDFTIVKQSIDNLSFSSSKMTELPDDYELEIELKESFTTNKDCTKIFLTSIIELYTFLHSDDIYKIEHTEVIKNYISLTFGNNPKNFKDYLFKPKAYFSGPQPVTLEKKNIVDDNLGVITIKKDYTVTDKADGERMLFYVNTDNKCYLINNRLSVKSLGITVPGYANTLVDGEFITQNIMNEPIMLFAAFDIYWYNKDDIRKLPLISKNKSDKTRISILNIFFDKIKSYFKDIKITVKEFKFSDNIFKDCDEILKNEKSGKYNYIIDGLIFTPQFLPVGASYLDDYPKSSDTWNRVFKWKPEENNTIDFLVQMKKNDFTVKNSTTYKVLELFVGYNPVQWENINAKTFLEKTYIENKKLRISEYIKKEFIPGDIFSPTFSQCTIQVENEKSKVCCINDDIIVNDSIVEFSYDKNENKWIPLRVRKDKTDMYNKHGLPGTANDYRTAINIWKSIQNPVTTELITGIEKINNIIEDDIYYFRSTKRDNFASKAMMDFHNQFIKKYILINRFKNKQNYRNLFDISCGKGGDLDKWIEGGFTKVFGVDISRDNIENSFDGVYARILENRNNNYNPQKLSYAFTVMDSSKKFDKEYIESLPNKDDKELNSVLWGLKETPTLNNYYKFANTEFDVLSCQFSIHYFFENETKLDNFIWNVQKHLRVGGYFIGTCLNGEKLKEKLAKTPYHGSITGKQNDRVLWNIKKLYKNDKTITIGDTIEVYMESIGQVIKEYVVSFDLLKAKLKKYNIEMLSKEELEDLQLKNSTETFDMTFKNIDNFDTSSFGNDFIKKIKNMSQEEKDYSFMNSWFIFVKRKSNKIILKKKV